MLARRIGIATLNSPASLNALSLDMVDGLVEDLESRAIIDPTTQPPYLSRPGHIFPLRYREGGVLKRAGHTEAAVDLARLGGRFPGGSVTVIATSRDADAPDGSVTVTLAV